MTAGTLQLLRTWSAKVALLASLLGASCDSDGGGGGNRAPEIQSVRASPTSVAAGGLTTLTCTATDADGDVLEYSWSSAEGSFPAGAGQRSVQWQAPDINGTYTIAVEVSDGQTLDTGAVAVEVSGGSINTAPTASFTVTPSSGTTGTTFQVNASGSSDSESSISQLEVRWDWENNGSYDTGWTTTKTASHQYSSNGNYTIKLQVRDPEGLTAETTRSLNVGSGGGGVAPPTMITVPAGQFMMGQTGVATPEHTIILNSGFLLGETEVTNAQYLEALNWAQAEGLVSVVGDYVQQYGVNLLRINQSGLDYCEIRYNAGTQQFYLHAGTYNAGSWGPGQAYPGGTYDPSNHPVNNVSWYGAAYYCDWRSQMEGMMPYYNGAWDQIPSPNNPYTATGYRLPTEAEWEFAAQHDDERSFPWGSASPTCTLVNYSISSSNRCVGWTTPVGSYPTGASALGLQDMAGNVVEWCNDWYAGYSAGGVSDPPGPASGSLRVMRGGSWYYGATFLQCAYRGDSGGDPSDAYSYYGFRLCRTLP